jgi:hypothetical protein
VQPPAAGSDNPVGRPACLPARVLQAPWWAMTRPPPPSSSGGRTRGRCAAVCWCTTRAGGLRGQGADQRPGFGAQPLAAAPATPQPGCRCCLLAPSSSPHASPAQVPRVLPQPAAGEGGLPGAPRRAHQRGGCRRPAPTSAAAPGCPACCGRASSRVRSG